MIYFVIPILLFFFQFLSLISSLMTDIKDPVFETPWELEASFDEILNDYKLEEHVINSDGYLLTLWHIVDPTVAKHDGNLEPVLMHHGLIDMGKTWLFNERNNSILFWMLEQKSYDIWLAHARESDMTKGHASWENY